VGAVGPVWQWILIPAILLGAQTPAAACYDEQVSEVGPVRISTTDESSSRLDCSDGAAGCATWAARLAQILPHHARLRLRSGAMITRNGRVEIELCLPRRPCITEDSAHGDIAKIFDELAVRLRVPASARRRARQLAPVAFTLQAGSFASEQSATALAFKIDEATGGVGAEITQGHPGWARSTWVDRRSLPDGRVVHRVFVGTFLGRASASRAAPVLATLTGEAPLVRALSQ
jgi:hypothetical protein